MKSNFSTSWKGSTQTRKQRKYIHQAPAHIRAKFVSASIHKALREKYRARSLPLRKGDKVKILRGSSRGKEATVERVDRTRRIIFLDTLRVSRRDGSEVPVGIAPSNLQIISVVGDDARRFGPLNKKQEKQDLKNDTKKLK